MNPKHQVIWAKVAENDLKEIVEFISVERPGNALKILKKIKAKAACL
jgi:toxin ParE1/3/4